MGKRALKQHEREREREGDDVHKLYTSYFKNYPQLRQSATPLSRTDTI